MLPKPKHLLTVDFKHVQSIDKSIGVANHHQLHVLDESKGVLLVLDGQFCQFDALLDCGMA